MVRLPPSSLLSFAQFERKRAVTVAGAAAEKLDRSSLGRLLQITLLAPDIIEAIVDGPQLQGATLPRLVEGFPLSWGEDWTPRKTSGCDAV